MDGILIAHVADALQGIDGALDCDSAAERAAEMLRRFPSLELTARSLAAGRCERGEFAGIVAMAYGSLRGMRERGQ